MPASAENITLVTDNFWNVILEEELHRSVLSQLLVKVRDIWPFEISNSIRLEGKRIDRQVINLSGGDSELQSIRRIIKGKEGIIILSPIFSIYGCELAQENPGLVFFAPCPAPPSECNGENLFYSVFDYSKAMYEAGAWAAEQIIKTSAIFYTGENGYRKRSEAFKHGWKSVKSLDEIKILEVRSLDRINEQTIEDFQTELNADSALAVVFAGPENNAVLEELDGGSYGILSENLMAWPESGFNTVASVELGPVRVLTEIIKSISIDSYGAGVSVKAEFFLDDKE